MGVLVLLGWCLCGGGPEPGLRIQAAPDRLGVEVVATVPAMLLAKLPAGKLSQVEGEQWLRFALLDESRGEEGPAILGRYERREGRLGFTPRYPLEPGRRYRATLVVGNRPITAEYQVPARETEPAPVVEMVYPSTGVLPANHLKFYVHFSRPMREGRAVFDHISLNDENGKPVADPWRRTELWSADGRRLTLWVHPGRVKRGVNLREELGPVLRPGRYYTLVVGPAVADAGGQPLAQPFTKRFRTTAEDHARLRVGDWKVRPPAAGSLRPALLDFPKPLDRALLERFLTVADAAGKPVAGKIRVGPEERSWAFYPERPWQAADYTVSVDGRLEDLAGNTPLRPFDADLQEPATGPVNLSIHFHPK